MSLSPLATKLTLPTLLERRVERPSLIVRLQAGFSGPLTLLSAPAGSGKTTLLVTALRHYPVHVAWVSLDPEDSDPIRFTRYVLAALQPSAPSLGEAGEAMGQATPPPSLATILSQVINALADLPQDLLLVLDDYHVIDTPAIHQWSSCSLLNGWCVEGKPTPMAAAYQSCPLR